MITSPAELRDVVLDMANHLDPDALSGETAAAMVAELARVEKVVASARMFMAIRVAKTGAWKGRGHASAADWLAAQCGMSVRQAAAQLGTANKAKDLPKTKEAMDRGRLSPDQAGAVADGAAADPACEEDLLSSAAKDTTKELRDKANRARAAATDTAARERRIRAERTLRMRTDADGAFTMWLRGPAHQGARLAAMMKPFLEDAFRQARTRQNTTGLRDTFDNRSHDAFYDLVEHLHALAALATGTDLDPAKAADTTGKPSSGSAGTPGTTGQSEPDAKDSTGPQGRLGPVAVEVARQLMDDAFIAAVVRDGTHIHTVTHLGRGLNAHQRTALEAAGIRCSNIACNQTVAIEIDHRTPWADQPVTELANQDPLCPRCHNLKTHRHHRLERGTGPRRLLSPQPTTTSSPRQTALI